MPGVLHYLQHEWNFYEFERAKWENERAELKVFDKIKFELTATNLGSDQFSNG